ncbi:MAG TPA: permease-like cell division protein FtsX [Candidatus Binatia bacterium]|nr:permease-like cell division protein FtsX [Candidatus Binatia bacterium]
MRRVLASIRFAIVAAVQNFARNFAVSMAGVFTMGLIMVLVGGTLLLSHTVDTILIKAESEADVINVYLQDSLSMRTIADYEQRLRTDPRADDVSFISKDEAVIVSQEEGFSFMQSAIAVAGSNPLPASIKIHARSLADLTQLNSAAVGYPIVDNSAGKPTSYSGNVIPTLQTVIAWTYGVGLVLSAVLAVISLVIIMNTIRTAVYIRRTEIEIMKLVGAGDWFVRWPFILEGMFGGLIAAALGAVIVSLAYRFLLQLANARIYLGITLDGGYLTAMVLILVVVGAGLGGVGSLLGMRRFLHV